MLRSRFAAALGFALVIGALGAAPVSAWTELGPCSGTCGDYAVPDQNGGPYGATCKYETNSYDLDWIKIQPPLMHGPYPGQTKVQWMYKIMRSKDFGSSYKSVHDSSWQTDTASSGAAANGFTSRTWNAPDPNPTGYYKVRLVLRWKDSHDMVVGTIKVEYDYYQRKWNGTNSPNNHYCLQDW
jgi:hypothetical protein